MCSECDWSRFTCDMPVLFFLIVLSGSMSNLSFPFWMVWHGSSQDLLQAHSSMLKIVFGKEAGEQVCDHAEDLWSIAEECRFLSVQSELGAPLFRNTAATVSIVQFNTVIAEAIPKLLIAEYTQQTHDDALQKLYATVDDFKQRGLPEVTRSITVRYLSFDVDEKCGIEQKLLAGACTCRKMVMDMLDQTSFDSIAGINHALSLASDSLIRSDPLWIIEQSFMTSSLTESMSLKLQQSVMAALPSATRWMSEDGVLNELRALERSSLYLLAPATAKGALNVTLDLVTKIKNNVSPPSHLQSSTDFFKKVLKQVENFFTTEAPAASSNEASQKLMGIDAMRFMVKELDKKGPLQVRISDIERLLCWRHALTAEEIAVLTSLLEKVVAKDPSARKRDPFEEKKEKKKKKEAKDDGDISQFF